MSRTAASLVSEQRLLKLVGIVTTERCGPNARYSVVPGSASVAECAPLDESAALGSAVKATRIFQIQSKLPVFMPQHEVCAMRLIGSALAHRVGTGSVGDAANTAASAILAAHEAMFAGGRPFGDRVKTATAAALQTPLSLDDHLGLALQFRQTFDSKRWSDSAVRHAALWEKTMRSSKEDAAAWSAYFYVVSSCGMLTQDPQFVKRTMRRLVGSTGGIQGTNNAAIDALAERIERDAKIAMTDVGYSDSVAGALMQAHAATRKK